MRACAGATLSKGINRGVGTLIGGGMGCLAAVLAAENGGIAKPTIVVISLFAYGALSFFLSFNFVIYYINYQRHI